VAYIVALEPSSLSKGWDQVAFGGKGATFGPFAGLATALGVSWLATLLYIDAIISPSRTRPLYVGTSARLTFGMGRPDSRAKIEHGKDAGPKVCLWHTEVRGRSQAKICSREGGADLRDGPLALEEVLHAILQLFESPREVFGPAFVLLRELLVVGHLGRPLTGYRGILGLGAHLP